MKLDYNQLYSVIREGVLSSLLITPTYPTHFSTALFSPYCFIHTYASAYKYALLTRGSVLLLCAPRQGWLSDVVLDKQLGVSASLGKPASLGLSLPRLPVPLCLRWDRMRFLSSRSACLWMFFFRAYWGSHAVEVS